MIESENSRSILEKAETLNLYLNKVAEGIYNYKYKRIEGLK